MADSSVGIMFTKEPGFCQKCGSILPNLGETGGVECYTCDQKYDAKVFSAQETTYIIHFNSYTPKMAQNIKEEPDDGPIIDRTCPVCGNDKMSYATLQLRSADEGQTIFYTCTKCKYKENENS